MNAGEAGVLVRFVAAICPSQQLDDLTADAWALVLDDVRAVDAMEAVRAIAKRPQPHDRRLTIEPDVIRSEVRRIRAARIEAAEPAFTPTTGDPDGFRRELRAWRTAAADGKTPKAITDPGATARPIEALTHTVTKRTAATATMPAIATQSKREATK
ncbi:hypothetical protein BI041_gp51 [Propionibacterium phage PFR2]|uniref:Uncharacterized protein n=2 Tax=Pulverervirus PFR1 TaxID=2170091 RepID=A0A173G9Q7_9CAUD|nr:hypothetical protein [Propionibacterium freudenreichii]YP_009287725.1 hypothetical protein BI042_gp49 [Propionibacterium phage PFR1]YP_009290958.1 hypothetical protein BI041_gp51 [Propionibacterium phage PFR2]ANH49915.1 hypothetical protein PFR_49 [Propionibacterium phage PFR1]ANH49973.1 hypothetical protein PFR2_49 [Propionibacterium phage PFR2]MDK9674424.1 hypothetical protein [Propionibacterium freudenreichii]CEI46732.1 Protein of unknown function [Propionibacterium freudenreichii]SCQ4